jgi:1-deoxy-D-xylulose-5-phosphate reductoisomerase
MVQFEDKTIMAQLGQTDMRGPIQYAFSYPERLKLEIEQVDFIKLSQLTFEAPDNDRFPNLTYAYEAIGKGGNMPCILNAANEVVVSLFLEERIGFYEMSRLIEKAMDKSTFIEHPTLSDYLQSDLETREIIYSLVNWSKP